MTVSTWRNVVAQFMKVALVLLVGASLSIGFWSVTAIGAPKPSPTPHPTHSPKPSPTPKPPKPSPTPKPGKCTVCDHGKDKDKDKQINCADVDKYLQNHPNSTRGPCQPTPVTNP